MAEHVVKELRQGMIVRPLMVFALSYDRTAMPDLSLWLPVLVDFFYYWVHRATHEVDALWSLHRRHHTTKHPTAYMLAFADEPQELFDLVGSPVLAYLLYPLSFDALLIWSLYFASVELMGHSGLRIYYPTSLTSPLMRLFNLEGIVEDHDLHHRFGWRDSFNYEKAKWDLGYAIWDCWPADRVDDGKH